MTQPSAHLDRGGEIPLGFPFLVEFFPMKCPPNGQGFEPVIFISGGTGAGTSTLAAAIAPIVRANGIIGTDALREGLRVMAAPPASRFSPEEALILEQSTFEVWKAIGSGKARPSPTPRNVVEGFFRQSDLVLEAVIGAARRAVSEGYCLIIEGVHLPLRRLLEKVAAFLSPADREFYLSRTFTIFLDCRDRSVQRQHLSGRDPRFSHRRNPERYLEPENWRSILLIGRELREQGVSAHVCLDSGCQTVSQEADAVARRFYEWKILQNGKQKLPR